MEKLTKKLDNKSRQLIKALRHTPDSLGLTLDKDGFTNILTVLKHLDVTYYELELIVKLNDKQRFELVDDKIRATQGHSIEIDENSLKLYTETNFGVNISYSDIVYHGTTIEALENILKIGISKMGRQFVHCSQDYETAIKVASRHSKDIVILKLDVKRSFSEWYISENNVILTKHVSPNAIIQIIYPNKTYLSSVNMYSNISLTPDGTILRSTHVHDYVEYIDKNGETYMVDGGTEYRRCSVNKEKSINLSVYEGASHDVVREHVMWGTRGKDGKQLLKYVTVSEMELDHILAIIETQKHISMKLFKVLTNELIYRKQHDKI